MERASDLNGHQEAGTFTGRPGNEIDKVSITANVRLSPYLKEARGVAHLRRYSDIVIHSAKFAIDPLYTKDDFFRLSHAGLYR